MTMRNREAIHVDISSNERVSNVSSGKVTTTKWNPGKGAAEAQAKAEAAVKEAWIAEQQREEATPLSQRLRAIEERLAAIESHLGGN